MDTRDTIYQVPGTFHPIVRLADNGIALMPWYSLAQRPGLAGTLLFMLR